MSYHSPVSPVPALQPSHFLRLEADSTRERSRSTGDFQMVSMMDTTPPLGDRESDSISPPLISRDSRSHSLTPQPLRKYPPYATLGRPKMSRGKTIDTSSIKKVELEDYSLLNQYKVFDIIGHGSFGIVHRATTNEDSETYALKIVRKRKLIKKGFPMRRPRGKPGPAQDQLSDIKKEIAILKKINHPNVVKLVEVLDDPNEDDMVLVFEFISNGSVMPEIIPSHRIPEQRARKYFIELILGLEYLHSQKIIHRDIKPENLLLDEFDTLKIADFGVSEEWNSDRPDTQLKKTAGTRAFAAPETLTSQPDGFSGKPLDIWAAGVTLYCFIYGKVPFSAPTVTDLYDQIQTVQVTFPDNVPVSLELRDLINKLLEKDPSRRITTDELRSHPWIAQFDGPIPSADMNCTDAIDVSDKEIEGAIKHQQTPIHILVMIKRMAKQKSLRNPFTDSTDSPLGSPTISSRNSSHDKRNAFKSTKAIPSISVSEEL